MAIRKKPRISPARGDVTIGTMTFHHRPPPSHQCLLSGTAQTMTFQLSCEAASAAPHKAPMSAWLELDGMPHHQVSRFQMMAPISTQMMMPEVRLTSCVWTRPEAIVLATAVPHNAPRRFVHAAINTACRGVRTLVETTVAMEFAVSWKPLMYSKTSATRITMKTRVMARQEFFKTM